MNALKGNGRRQRDKSPATPLLLQAANPVLHGQIAFAICHPTKGDVTAVDMSGSRRTLFAASDTMLLRTIIIVKHQFDPPAE